MATPVLPPDFKEFLKFLNAKRVEYLLVGGYAVGYHGYPRGTADIDFWVAISPANARNVTAAIREFGFTSPELTEQLFTEANRVARMGLPPFRIEVITSASGVNFSECYSRRVIDVLDGVPVNIISLEDLKTNKAAAGRPQDLNDLQHLP